MGETMAGGDAVRPSLIQRFVFWLDERLRRGQQVFEYSDRPDCVFRIQRSRSRSSYVLSDGVAVHEGDPIIELHLWNEHLPKMPAARASIGWGSRLAHGFRSSLRELCAWLDARPDYDDAAAVYANMGLGGAKRTEQLVRWMCGPLGLEPVNDGHRPTFGQHLHRLGDNILGLMLVMATNPVAARADMLMRHRARVAISRSELRRRYGGAGGNER
jgi:hypothetical protein